MSLEVDNEVRTAYQRKGDIDHQIAGWKELVEKTPLDRELRCDHANAYGRKLIFGGHAENESIGSGFCIELMHIKEREISTETLPV